MTRVLIVEDDFRVARLHADIVSGVDGVEVVGLAGTAAAARETAAAERPDLVLLDEYLPDLPGSRLIRHLNAAVLMVTADNDPQAVRRMLGAGALGVVLKPFPPAVLVGHVEAYVRFRELLDGVGGLDQTGIDRAVAVLHGGAASSPVAKGRSAVTADSIRVALQDGERPKTATEVADQIGINRTTARRYLSDLVEAGRVELSLRYGSTGRPEHWYSWIG